jgi:hypothetical protein
MIDEQNFMKLIRTKAGSPGDTIAHILQRSNLADDRGGSHIAENETPPSFELVQSTRGCQGELRTRKPHKRRTSTKERGSLCVWARDGVILTMCQQFESQAWLLFDTCVDEHALEFSGEAEGKRHE